MGGISPNAAKYIIRIGCEVEGMVDKSDVIGAIFGQTEGLFNEEYDFRSLLEKGRIGRIIVDLDVKDNKSVGKILIPSNLDKAETALIASIAENVDRIGPYSAKLTLEGIEDTRLERLNRIITRAKEILDGWDKSQKKLDVKEMLQDLVSKVRETSVVQYGPEKLDAGPDVDSSDSIIIVEGRADVINLLRYGYRNVISLGGASERVPRTIIELCRTKEATAFLDGDRGGDLILKRLLEVAEIDFVARAPQGREVEELTAKEIMKALTGKVPAPQALQQERPQTGHQQAYAQQAEEEQPQQQSPQTQSQPQQQTQQRPRPPVPEKLAGYVRTLGGTLEAVVLDSEFAEVARMPVKELADRLQSVDQGRPYALVFDGVISQRILDMSSEKGIRYVIGSRLGNVVRKPSETVVVTFDEVV
ncbi:MAG: DNA primase DnaG [Thermoprotei archaeon]